MKKDGFSLIETLFASCLTLFLIITTAELNLMAIRTTRKAALISEMTNALISQVENLKALPVDAAETTEGIHERIIPSKKNYIFVFNWSVINMGQGLKKINARLSIDRSSQPPISLTIFISEKLGF